MSELQQNPLIQALPPETDYLTYLTILEYNLSKEQLPLLHELLQDTVLTANIGWDLVSLLLPLLPESEQCLQDVAFRGNPRETVLKVAELLEELGNEETLDEDDDHDTNHSSGIESADVPQAVEMNAGEDFNLLDSKFQCLLHMLCIIHPRIKTRHPSRFLATSLQAVIKAYKAIAYLPSSTAAIFMLLKSLSGSKRPHLPPRRSQQAVPLVSSGTAAPDPEAQVVPAAEGEEKLKLSILRSFVTHAVAIYVLSLPLVDDASQYLWCNRFFEKQQPESVLPRRTPYRTRFRQESDLERRDANINQFLVSFNKALVSPPDVGLQDIADADLLMSWDEVLKCITEPVAVIDAIDSTVFSSEIAFSRLGALHCIAAKTANALLYNRPFSLQQLNLHEHERVLNAFLDLEHIDIATFSVIDAVLILGWAALELGDGVVATESRAEFNRYLQCISSISANTPSPSLRYQAHVFVSAVLHGNPSSEARLDFIKDTLEHCPHQNLKVSAVGWLKEETLQAFNLHRSSPGSNQGLKISGIKDEDSNCFTQPSALELCAPWLFAAPDTSSGEEMPLNLPFWLAVLNFYYLLCSSPLLFKALEVHQLSVEFNVGVDFLEPLAVLARSCRDLQEPSTAAPPVDHTTEICALEDVLHRLQQVRNKSENSKTLV